MEMITEFDYKVIVIIIQLLIIMWVILLGALKMLELRWKQIVTLIISPEIFLKVIFSMVSICKPIMIIILSLGIPFEILPLREFG